MSTTASLHREPVLTRQAMNPAVLQAEYAVRGAIPLRAEELRVQLEQGKGDSLPFDEVVSCNIGNPQQLDQKPLTFLRQVSINFTAAPACRAVPRLDPCPIAGIDDVPACD